MTFTWQTVVAGMILGFAVVLALQWVGAVPIAGASSHRVTICHIPPGNPDNAHTITVGAPSIPAHLAHGDILGVCRTEVPTSTATPVAPVEQEPTATPDDQGPIRQEQPVTETSSIQVVPTLGAIKLPVTGGVEGDLANSGNAWAAWLLVAGFLSSGMAFVVRIRS